MKDQKILPCNMEKGCRQHEGGFYAVRYVKPQRTTTA